MSAELAHGTNDLVIGSAVQAPMTELMHYATMDPLPTSCGATTLCSGLRTQHELSSFSGSMVTADQCGESHGRASEDNLGLDVSLGTTTEYVGCFSSDLAARPTANEEDVAFNDAASSADLKEKSSATAAELLLCPTISTASEGAFFAADIPTAISKIATSQGIASILGDVCVRNQHSLAASSGPHASQSPAFLPNVCVTEDATEPTAEVPTVADSISAVKMTVRETSTAAAAAASEAMAAAAETVVCTLSAGKELLADSSVVIADSIASSVVPVEPSMALAAAGAGNTQQMADTAGNFGEATGSLAAALVVEAMPATQAETTAEASTSGDQWKLLSKSLGCETAQLPVAALSANEFQPITTFSFENPLYAEREFVGDGSESRTVDADSLRAVMVAGMPGANQLHGIGVYDTSCGNQMVTTTVEPGLVVDNSLGANAFVPQFNRDDSGDCIELEKHSPRDKVCDGNVVCLSSGEAAAPVLQQMYGTAGICGVEAGSLAAALIVEAMPETRAETTTEASTSGDRWKPLSESSGSKTARLPVGALSSNQFQPITTFSFENPLYVQREFIGDGSESRTAAADSLTAVVVAGIPGANQLHGIAVFDTPCGDQMITATAEPGLAPDNSLGASACVPQFNRNDSGECVELEKHSPRDKVCDGNVACPSSGDTAAHITDVGATSQLPKADSSSAKCGPSAVTQATEHTTLVGKAHDEHVDDVEDTDDDAGIYDESYRSSKWLFVGKDSDDEIDQAIADPSKSDTSQSSDPTSAASSEDSSAVVSSARNESDRRGVYRSISCKTVTRHSSVEVFHRENTRIIEPDKTVALTRKSTSEDFGFHIKGCHPIVVTVVKPGSLADAAGVKIGDVLLAVNYQSVLSLTHEQTLQLIAADSLTLVLELCSKLDGLVTGTVPLLIYAQPEVSSAAMVVRSGYLSKITGFLRLWKRFWFVLKPDKCLYYYRTETDKEPLGAIPLSGYTLCRATDVKKDYTVKLFSSRSTYYLAGESESDIVQWAEVLNRACASTSSVSDIWLETSAHNVSLPALALKSPDCHGQLTKLGCKMKTWRRRYCVLKDACIYYYVSISSTSAQGVAHLHGYTVDPLPSSSKKNAFNLVPPNSKMRTFYFYAETEFEKDRWVRAMTLSIGRWARLDGQGARRRSTATLSKSGSINEEAADRAVLETHQPSCLDDEPWALVESSH